MNNNLPELTNDQQGQSSPDSARRRLLRAAASAAPLIATLPSGAAFATASTYQCISKDKAASAGTVPNFDDYKQSLDQWYRSKAYRVVWTHTSSPDIPTYRFSTDEVNGPFYLEEGGGLFDLTKYPGYTKGSAVEVYVLRLYVPDNASDPTDVYPACTNPNGAGVPNGTASPSDQCVFPFTNRQGDVMALTGSCWCSISGDC
jgi:hypothetical protein